MRNLLSFADSAAPSRTAPLGLALATTAAVIAATASTSEAATYDITDYYHDRGPHHILSFGDVHPFGFDHHLHGHGHHSYLFDHGHSTHLSFGAYSQIWTKTTLFETSDEYTQIIIDAQKNAEARKAAIAQRMSVVEPTDANPLRTVKFNLGIETPNEMTFEHTSGKVGLVKHIVDGKEVRYASAHTALDPENYEMFDIASELQVDPATRNVGDNARANALYLIDENGQPVNGGVADEFQVTVGYDMNPEHPITISLLDASGAVTGEINANQFQVKKVEDYVVLVMEKSAHQDALTQIDAHMKNGGQFQVTGTSYPVSSPEGLEVTTDPFGFGESFTNDLQKTYDGANEQKFHFPTPANEVNLALTYDPTNFEVLDTAKVLKCEYLNLSDEQLRDPNTTFIEAFVQAGTGKLPRDFEKAVIALNANAPHGILAAGESGYSGMEFLTGDSTLSNSATGGYTTSVIGAAVVGGCTGELKGRVPFKTPTTSITTTTYGSGASTIAGGFTTGGFGIFTPGGGTPLIPISPPTNPPTTPPTTPPVSPVPLPWGGLLLLTGLGGLGVVRKLRQSSNDDSTNSASKKHPALWANEL